MKGIVAVVNLVSLKYVGGEVKENTRPPPIKGNPVEFRIKSTSSDTRRRRMQVKM